MAWAALVRGTASLEKTVTPASASFSTSSGSCGPFEKADHDLSLAQVPDLILRRALHLDQYVGLGVDILRSVHDRGPGLLVVFVQVVVAAGARLDDDLEAVFDKPADGLGHEPDPALALGYLPHDPYLHAPDYSVGSDAMLTGPTVPLRVAGPPHREASRSRARWLRRPRLERRGLPTPPA